MIDWMQLALHVCWIFGASLLLSEVSYNRWEKTEQIPVNDKVMRGRLIREIVAVILIGFGLSMTAGVWWQRLLWIVVALLLLAQIYLSRKPSSD